MEEKRGDQRRAVAVPEGYFFMKLFLFVLLVLFVLFAPNVFLPLRTVPLISCVRTPLVWARVSWRA